MKIENRSNHIANIRNLYQAVHGLAPEWLHFDRMTDLQLIGMTEQLEELHQLHPFGYEPHPYHDEPA